MSVGMTQPHSDRFAAIRQASPAILPSLLMCDFGDLRGEIGRLVDAGAGVLHLDVMDGHFVPNLTYGMPIVAGLRRHTDLPLDVHLMISDPLAYAPAMADAGADLLTFHAEAVDDLPATVATLRELGVGVGVAINPQTPVDAIAGVLPDVDLVLVMSVPAGFGGQPFDVTSLDKLRDLRSRRPDLLLQIDGGINQRTIGPARQAGCDLFVVGSAIFGQDDYDEAMASLETAMAGSVRER